MGRTRPLLIALLVVASVGIVPGTVVADDQWADDCGDAQVLEAGEYTGFLGPGDTDAFKVRMTDGDYITMNVQWDDSEASLSFDQMSGIIVSVPRDDPAYVGTSGYSIIFQDEDSDGRVQFQVFAEEDGLICLPLEEAETGGVPTNWRMSFARGDTEPPELASPERISELESQVEQKNQRISQLETILEQKNQTISELESRISELEAQSSNGSGGDVTIQVTVTPANGQQNFVEGGQAVVQAESENADVSEMSVEYGSGAYQLDSSGQVAIPLAQTGTQEMTLVYGDITKQVSFEVQAEGEQNQQNQQNQQDTTPTGTSGPGFGIVVALIAILGSAFLLQRYRQS